MSKSVNWKPITEISGNPDNPRQISEEKFNQLKKSIQDFPEMLELRPLVVREGMVLGGNMRLEALSQLGYKKVPVIDASELTDEQIKEFVIKDNIPFGQWDWDVLANEWDSEALNEWGLEVWQNEGENEGMSGGLTEEERKYVGKIQSPIYEITREDKPSFDKLINKEKFNDLTDQIEAADIPDEDKEFLRLAAYRHLQFNYENIAEYYAHSSEKVKELMEDSALVIIDFDKAIEHGYAQLNEEMIEIFRQDEQND